CPTWGRNGVVLSRKRNRRLWASFAAWKRLARWSLPAAVATTNWWHSACTSRIAHLIRCHWVTRRSSPQCRIHNSPNSSPGFPLQTARGNERFALQYFRASIANKSQQKLRQLEQL